MEAEERKTAMSHDEMQDYWETLCSFTGEDIPNEVNQLMAKIRYPRFLYKYRAVNNNNLDALRSNKLFFSKASSYDDLLHDGRTSLSLHEGSPIPLTDSL